MGKFFFIMQNAANWAIFIIFVRPLGGMSFTLRDCSEFFIRADAQATPRGGGQGGHGPPKGLTKMIKMAQFAAFCIIKKKFSHGACPQTPLIRYLRRIFGTKIGTMPVEARALSQKKIVSQIMPLTLKSIEKCHKA